MPIYEYRCGDCGSVSSFFTRSINSELEPRCQQCQSGDMQRRISSFALGKTTRPAHEGSAAGSGNPLDYYRDPRNIGRHVEESFSRHGVEMPQSVRDNIDAVRQGQLPKEVNL